MVRLVRTNELQLSRAGVRRPLPRVRSVRTNELQLIVLSFLAVKP